MKVICLERIENLGQMGDTVVVKPGFARNYLLPRKKVLRANAANKAYFETFRARLEADSLKRRQDAEVVAEKMSSLAVTMVRQASENNHLYGSVSARDIQQALAQSENCIVERQQIVLDQPIKALGIHQIRIVLHPEVETTVILSVARSTDEGRIALDAWKSATAKSEEETPTLPTASVAEPSA